MIIHRASVVIVLCSPIKLMKKLMNIFYFANEGIYRDMGYKKIQINRVTLNQI